MSRTILTPCAWPHCRDLRVDLCLRELVAPASHGLALQGSHRVDRASASERARDSSSWTRSRSQDRPGLPLLVMTISRSPGILQTSPDLPRRSRTLTNFMCASNRVPYCVHDCDTPSSVSRRCRVLHRWGTGSLRQGWRGRQAGSQQQRLGDTIAPDFFRSAIAVSTVFLSRPVASLSDPRSPARPPSSSRSAPCPSACDATSCPALPSGFVLLLLLPRRQEAQATAGRREGGGDRTDLERLAATDGRSAGSTPSRPC